MYYYSPSTQGFYSSEVHSTFPDDCFEVSDEKYNELLFQQQYGKEIVYTPELNLHAKDYEVFPLTWDDIRTERNSLLAQSDWTQLPDVPETLKAKWAVYRQQLRDITEAFATPDLVVWPDTPV